MHLTKEKIGKAILMISMLVMGACGLMYEYALSVLGNYLMGTSHEQIFIIIGLMLFSMGMGTIIQRIISSNLLEAFLLIEILLGFIGGMSTISIYSAYAFWEASEVILYSFAILIGILIGMEIPILIRINKKFSQSLKSNLSEILSVDYIGSLIGAFLFTYVLLVHFSLAKIAFILGMTNALLGFISLIFFWQKVQFRKRIFVLLIFIIAILITGLFHADDWTKKIEQKYYQDPIIFSTTSRYQHIVVTKWKNRVNLYINGHLQFSSMDEKIYHEFLVHVPMSIAKTKERVLILGGGDGLALREVLKYKEVKEVFLIDIDPVITEISSSLPELVKVNNGAFTDSRVITLPSNGVRPGEKIDVLIKNQRKTKIFSDKLYPVAKVFLIHLDADKFIKNIQGLFDVIIIDFPDPGILELAKLYSLDFYRILKKRLNTNGYISLQATSPFFAKDAFLCIGKTLESAGFKALPYQGTIPSFAGQWGWYLGWKNIFSKKEVLQKFQGLSRLNVETSYLTKDVLLAGFVFGKNRLKPDSPININTKLYPRLVHYYRSSWEKWD